MKLLNNNNFKWKEQTIKKSFQKIDYLESLVYFNNLNKKRQSMISSSFNKLDKNGNTALMFACCYKTDLIDDLFKYSEIDINKQNQYGTNALMSACRFKGKAVSKLLNHPAINVNCQNNNGNNALMIACLFQPDVLFDLLSHPAIDLNQKNKKGETMMDIAQQCHHCDSKMIEGLINNIHIKKDIQLVQLYKSASRKNSMNML